MKKLIELNWTQLESTLRSIISDKHQKLSLKDTPAFPLAFNVEMPQDFKFDNGHLDMAFNDMRVQGQQALTLNSEQCHVSDTRMTVELTFPCIEMLGHYQINSQQAPHIKMDTAGSMLDFEDNDYQPAGAAAGDQTPLTPEQKTAMLDQARTQEQHLRETPNGQQLLDTFNEHNETYNTVFVTSSAARTAWAANGVTKAAALDTHTALGDSKTVINQKDKQYAPNVTYNSNAFNQQLQIVVNTVAADPDFNPFDPKAKLDPNSKYVKASLAAMTFGYSVNDTGNDKSKVTEMNKDSVYSNVKSGKPPKDATVDELKNIIDQGVGEGGADEMARRKKWRILDEEDRGKVRRFLFEAMKERLLKMNNKPILLWQGDISSQFSQASARLELDISRDGQRIEVLNSQVRLPAFSIELDDQQWQGKAGDIVRERISQIFFIRRLLHDKIETGLCRLLGQVMPQALKQVLK